MTGKYNEVMDRVEVTGEMRRKILRNIRQTPLTGEAEKSKKTGLPWKILSAAACLILMIGVFSVPAIRQEHREPPVEAVNGIAEAASPEELSEMVGFEVSGLSGLPFEVQSVRYVSYWNDLAEIEYSGDMISCTYRQSKGEEDNSGDYTAYEITEKRSIGGMEVTLKGHAAGEYLLAVWSCDGTSYSVAFSEGMPAEVFTRLISEGRPENILQKKSLSLQFC